MTIDAYINPDFGWDKKLIFLLAAILGVFICIFFIIGCVRISVSTMTAKRSVKKREFYDRTHNCVQRFYEMIIAGTSVMSFSCAYVIINHISGLATERGVTPDSAWLAMLLNAWSNGKDFVLLLLICLSCVLNSLLDKLIVPLKKTSREEKATVRMLAMFYVIFILIYLNIIGDESEYNPVMMYYLGLMVGRFVYFDASFRDFINSLKNMFKNIYLLIMGLILTGLLCYFGFQKGYLLERNYYIVGAFYTHLFMLAAVFILHHSHILHLLVRKPKGYTESDVSGDDDSDYDDAGTDYYDEYDPDYDDDEEDYEDSEDGYYEDDYTG